MYQDWLELNPLSTYHTTAPGVQISEFLRLLVPIDASVTDTRVFFPLISIQKQDLQNLFR